VAQAVLSAARAEQGSILVFLPGAPEIRRVHRLLADALSGP
jgi:ATP-dependent helicase HrpB